MATKKNVGIVVISWNNADIIDECFQSIQQQTHAGIRTVLVDNNSSDDTVAKTKKLYPWVEVIESPTNGGFTAGNNIGIDYLLKDKDIEYVVLLNSDAQLSERWVENALTFAVNKPKGAFYQGTTLDYYDREVVDSTHIYVARNGQATQGSWRTMYDGDVGPAKVFGVNAAACMISRRFIDEQPFEQLFDESFFMYLEDVDICTRALILGWESFVIPNATAYHMGSASSGKNPGFSLYMTYRNNLAMLYKNFPLGMFLRMMPRVVKSDYHTVRGLLRDGQTVGAKKLLKGRFVGIFRMFLYVGKRRAMRSRAAIDDEYLWHLMAQGW